MSKIQFAIQVGDAAINSLENVFGDYSRMAIIYIRRIDDEGNPTGDEACKLNLLFPADHLPFWAKVISDHEASANMRDVWKSKADTILPEVEDIPTPTEEGENP